MANRANLPSPAQHEQMPDALNLFSLAGFENDHRHTVYSIAISESEFMKFNLDNDGSPGTMVSLLLSRAIAKLFPEAKDIIRIALCVNQRRHFTRLWRIEVWSAALFWSIKKSCATGRWTGRLQRTGGWSLLKRRRKMC